MKDPDSLCSSVTWKDEEDRVIWVYRIQDTPGYGRWLPEVTLLHQGAPVQHSKGRWWTAGKPHNTDNPAASSLHQFCCTGCMVLHIVQSVQPCLTLVRLLTFQVMTSTS